MNVNELIETYPRIYHMAAFGTWESIEKHGLLSTSALLDLFGVTGDERASIERRHRPEWAVISHPDLGTARIRDQKPMRESALSKCLVGMTAEQWYQLLNSKVFFWLTPERLSSLLNARAYRNTSHCVLTIDTKKLLDRHGDRVTLSPINSGSTLYNPPARGSTTFMKVGEYPFALRRKVRSRSNAIAELTVDWGVMDIRELVESVVHRQRDEVKETIV